LLPRGTGYYAINFIPSPLAGRTTFVKSQVNDEKINPSAWQAGCSNNLLPFDEDRNQAHLLQSSGWCSFLLEKQVASHRFEFESQLRV
jgi:hypothetical protein